MMQTVCGIFSEWNIDLHFCTLPRRGIDLKQSIYKFGTFAQVYHAKTAVCAFIISLCYGFHIKAQAIIYNLQQGNASYPFVVN